MNKKLKPCIKVETYNHFKRSHKQYDHSVDHNLYHYGYLEIFRTEIEKDEKTKNLVRKMAIEYNNKLKHVIYYQRYDSGWYWTQIVIVYAKIKKGLA